MVILMKSKEFYIHKLDSYNMMNKNILKHFDISYFEKGQCILHQGQRLEKLYILIDGKTKSCHTTSNGTTILIAISQGISVIGEIEFLNHRDIINDVYSIEECICLSISILLYQDLLLNDLLFMRYLAETISHKLYNTNQNSSISINYPVENRLASYLVSCEHDMIIQENFVQVAEMIGCSYRQLQRTLNTFIQMGYITKIKRGQFRIIDIHKLQRLGQDLYYIEKAQLCL